VFLRRHDLERLIEESTVPARAPVAERRLKECTEALEDFAEQVYQARERP